MNRVLIILISTVIVVGSTVRLSAAESETFTGTAARTGTYKRPLLDVDGKRYELKALDKANASVAEMLAGFSQGDTGTYAVVGTRGTVNGQDGIIVDSIDEARQLSRQFVCGLTPRSACHAASWARPSSTC